MTRAQVALAVGVPEKWLHNAATSLRVPLPYTPAGARRLAVARGIQRIAPVSLQTAYHTAGRVLAASMPASGLITVAETEDGAITLDLRRVLSTFAARLGRALQYSPRRAGRRPRTGAGARRDARARARDYGIDLGLIDSNLRRPRADRLYALDANAEFTTALRGRRHAGRRGAA